MNASESDPSAAEQEVPVCPRHPDRVSYISCQRCGRPTCADCQRQAAVGVQCVDCVAEGAKQIRTPTTRFGADATRQGRPWVTLTIIGLCVLIYVGQQVDGRVTDWLSFVPALAENEPWRFLTVAFVHSPTSFFHIIFNMYALWITGTYLEPLLGRLRFVVLYLISALGGSVGYLALADLPETSRDYAGWLTPTVGASGAVFGLFAAVLILNRHMGRQSAGIAIVLVINTVLGFVIPNIAWQAHLGGAITGALLAGCLALTSAPGNSAEARARRRWQWPGIVAVLVLIAAVAVWRILSVDTQEALRIFWGG